MSVKKFKFISPGIFLSEVDNSQLPAAVEPMGPIIIGRAPYGPGMRPIKITSFSEYVQTFGNPIPGKTGGDIWRNGNLGGPTYGAYAAQAYFKPQVGPVTYLRLLGCQSPGANVATGLAGWSTGLEPSDDIAVNGGAYGLFICRSGSVNPQPGYLGAIFYSTEGAVIMTGSLATTASATTYADAGTCGLFNNIGSEMEWKAQIISKTDTTATAPLYTTAFNFDEASAKYIRNVFNTNPQLTNSDVVGGTFSQGQDQYWLGESYASFISAKASSITPATERLDPASCYALLVPLETSADIGKDEYRIPYAEAETGWFFSQDISTETGSFDVEDMQKLFQFVALDGGRWTQDNLKISIQDLKYSRDTSGKNPYGSFTVLVRSSTDNDNVVRVIERFSNVNLNPTSQNYIARLIGDKYFQWDDNELRLRQYGEYNTQSKYIRVVMNRNVNEGVTDPAYLPFGVYGPPKFNDCVVTGFLSGSTGTDAVGTTCASSIVAGGNTSIFPVTGAVHGGISTGSATIIGSGYVGIPAYTASLRFPDVATRLSASRGGIANPTDAYFGLQTSLNLPEDGSLLYLREFADYLWPPPMGIDTGGPLMKSQWVFTLDDITAITNSAGTLITDASWSVGSRVAGDSITASGSLTTSASYKAVIDAGYDRFTSPLAGGFDGLDITELEPFRNTLLDDDLGETDSYAYYTVKRAIDTIADPEFVECNLITYPGLTEPTLTTKIVDVCEDRGDALAVIDIPGVYVPFTENTESFDARIESVDLATNSLESRQLNSSYGCTYYPWVQVRDTIKGNLLWVPPSVIALGTFASSEAKSELWFAPAGFNRGGLTGGSAGLPVLAVTQRLTSKDRDKLYEANINPIASFPSEGIVVFGQKTLQTTRSALDRINVRRLMVYIKKEVSRIAATILFDQNVKVTWERFLGQVNPFLSSVQSRLGLTEFKVILDETTTTPDLIDRNILYAKIFLKPARAIEFIAIDFVITRSGASFED